MSNPNDGWYGRAACIPGRSNTRSKAPGKMFEVGAGPMFAADGYDATVMDVSGRSYIDMLCALGAVSLGYTPSSVALGVLSLPHTAEVCAAEAVLRVVAPWATQVRFTRTGSEALSAARMVAQAATGAHTVLVADTAYHGWHPWTAWRGRVWTDGEYTLTYRYGSMASVEAAAAGVGDRVAAIFIEPSRWELTSHGWLCDVATFAKRIGALLVMDEMIYGGRAATGGMTERVRAHAGECADFLPDLACYGKAIGNGAPVACVVGNDALRAHGELVSGTYGGDVAAAEAVLRTLDTYRQYDVPRVLLFRGSMLRAGLETVVAESRWKGRAWVEGALDAHLRLRFDDQTGTLVVPSAGRRFAAGMAEHGVLWHPDCVNVCAAHTSEQLAAVVEAAAAVLAGMD